MWKQLTKLWPNYTVTDLTHSLKSTLFLDGSDGLRFRNNLGILPSVSLPTMKESIETQISLVIELWLRSLDKMLTLWPPIPTQTWTVQETLIYTSWSSMELNLPSGTSSTSGTPEKTEELMDLFNSKEEKKNSTSRRQTIMWLEDYCSTSQKINSTRHSMETLLLLSWPFVTLHSLLNLLSILNHLLLLLHHRLRRRPRNLLIPNPLA